MSGDATDPDSGPEDLLLIGYMSLQPFGYALPCFGSSANANGVFSARCSIPGDHAATVAAFDELDEPQIVSLAAALQRRVAVGTAWTDVFLWNGDVFVGTAPELREALTASFPELSTRAPMSGFDLMADFGDAEQRRSMAQSAIGYLSDRHGDELAAAWVDETARSRLEVLAVRHGLDLGGAAFDIRRSPRPAADVDALLKTTKASAGRGAFLTAASSLAADLGIVITAIPVSSQAAAERPFQAAADPGRVKALILTSGPRALEIAGAARPLEWEAEWGPDAFERSPLPDFNPDGRSGPASVNVEMRAAGSPSEGGDYAAVVVLVDDEYADDRGRLEMLADEARKSALKGAPVVLAPALPKNEPSRILTGDPARRPRSGFFDFILDTSVVRSPLRQSKRRLSLERKLADQVFGIAALLGGGAPVNRWAVKASGEETLLISFTVQRLRDGLTSESHVSDGRALIIREGFRVIAANGRRHEAGELVAMRQNLDFETFAWAVRQNDREAVPGRHDMAPASLPDDIRVLFAAPSMCAGFSAGEGLRICLVAESPSLSAVCDAARLGWVAMRYSDAGALHRLLYESGARAGFLPDDIRIPYSPRLPFNRRLATRGVDPRDTITLARVEWETLTRERPSPLSPFVRPYVERAGPHVPDSVVVPASEVLAYSATDFVSKAVKARAKQGTVRAKRTEDLNTAWRSPAQDLNRYIIQDGRLPPSVTRLAEGHVPAQAFFILDGDAAAAALFRSRVFEVWARATRSKASGWMSRFSMTGTFETFPVPAPFLITSTGPSREVRLTQADMRSRRLAQLADAEQGTAEGTRGGDGGPLEAEIRNIYGLKTDAGDLDILNRLILLAGTLEPL